MENNDQSLSDEQRTDLLNRIHRKGSVIGTQLPTSMQIGDTELNLRDFVVRTRNQEVVPPDQRDRVRQVRATLSRERKKRKGRLERDPLTVTEGTELAETIIGLDRAIAALTDLREPTFRSDKRDADLERERTWIGFLQRITEE